MNFEKDKSEMSTILSSIPQTYLTYIQQIKKENNYKARALTTAQNLIANYQRENDILRNQNNSLTARLTHNKLQIDQLHKIITILEEKILKHKNDYQKNEQILNFAEKQRVQTLNEHIIKLLNNQEHYEEIIQKLQQKLYFLEKKTTCMTNIRANLAPNLGSSLLPPKKISKKLAQACPSKKNLYDSRKTTTGNLKQLKALHIKMQNKDAQSLNKNRKLVQVIHRVLSVDKLDKKNGKSLKSK